jgi:hypothetical protein
LISAAQLQKRWNNTLKQMAATLKCFPFHHVHATVLRYSVAIAVEKIAAKQQQSMD